MSHQTLLVSPFWINQSSQSAFFDDGSVLKKNHDVFRGWHQTCTVSAYQPSWYGKSWLAASSKLWEAISDRVSSICLMAEVISYQYLYGILWLSFCVELWFWVLSKLVIGFSIFVSSSVIMRFFFNRFDTLQLWCSIAYFGRKSLLCYYPVFH